MNFDDAKTALKDGYVQAGFKLVDEHPTDLFFRYRSEHIRISEQEISDFASVAPALSSLKTLPVECAICSSTYREQVITGFPPSSRQIIFGDTNGLFVEMSRASKLFLNYFRFHHAYLELCLHRLRLNRNREAGRDFLYHLATIKVHNINEATPETAIARTSSLIHSCLFELTYLDQHVYALAENWPLHQPASNKPFRFQKSSYSPQRRLPTAAFNVDTVRFYQRGMDAHDPVIEFISFYQVLEYHFVSVTDAHLYHRLSQRLNDPKFSTTPANLDQIISEVKTHQQETDELKMLKAVLETYVEETELIAFVEQYEEYLGNDKKIYTNPKQEAIFGEKLVITPKTGHVLGNIATRIKTIRNALVHSSDRYRRQARYIPSVVNESIIALEIPLLRYLAERVIIGTARIIEPSTD
jgi:hypothetical protein